MIVKIRIWFFFLLLPCATCWVGGWYGRPVLCRRMGHRTSISAELEQPGEWTCPALHLGSYGNLLCSGMRQPSPGCAYRSIFGAARFEFPISCWVGQKKNSSGKNDSIALLDAVLWSDLRPSVGLFFQHRVWAQELLKWHFLIQMY